MYANSKNKNTGFPDPIAPKQIKESLEYGLSYAKAIASQWGTISQENSLMKRRSRTFERNRKYANGTQDTTIYRQLLTSLDPNNGDGSFLNLDFTPVPILPKFVRIVVNKILSSEPYPNLEAVDPLSSSEKDMERRKVELIRNKGSWLDEGRLGGSRKHRQHQTRLKRRNLYGQQHQVFIGCSSSRHQHDAQVE